MAYTPVSVRTTTSKSTGGYVPVAQRPAQPVAMPPPTPSKATSVAAAGPKKTNLVLRTVANALSPIPGVGNLLENTGLLNKGKELFKSAVRPFTPVSGESNTEFAKETLKQIPQQLAKQVGQPQIRAYGAIPTVLGLKPLIPQGQFQEDLYGTNKPITLTRSGRETLAQDPDAPTKGAIGKVAFPAVGLATGALDLIPGGEGANQAVKSLSKEARSFLVGQKDIHTIAEFLKSNLPGLSEEVIHTVAPKIATLSSEKKVVSELNKAIKANPAQYTPVAKRTAAIAEEISKSLRPLAEEARKYGSADEFMKSEGIVPEWGTANQYLRDNPYRKELSDMAKSGDFNEETLHKASRWEMEQVLKDKPAYLNGDGISDKEVMEFAQKHHLYDTTTADGSLIVAKNKEAAERVIAAIEKPNGQRDLGLALGYRDIGTDLGTKPRAAKKALEDLYTQATKESKLPSIPKLNRPNTKLEKMAEKSPTYEDFYRRSGVTQEVLDSTARSKGFDDAEDFYRSVKEDVRYLPTEEESILKSLEGTAAREVDESGLPRRSTTELTEGLNASKQALEDARTERAIARDIVPEMPGRAFSKFESRNRPGELPEVKPKRQSELLNKKGQPKKDTRGEFEKRGDQIAADLGFNDMDDARKAFSEYKAAKARQKEVEETVSKRVKDYRDRKAVFDEVVRYVKKEGAARRERVKLVQDFFSFGNDDMKALLKNERDVRLMSDGEFDDFMKRLEGRATERYLKMKDLMDLKTTIFEKEFVKLDNLRKVMKFPTIEKMTPRQLQQFNMAMKEFEKGDEFLTVRQLETIKNTPLDGIYTMREARERLLMDLNLDRERRGLKPVTTGDLENIKIGETDRYLYDVALADKHPLLNLMVHDTQKLLLGAELKTFDEKEQIDTLLRAARQSRKRSLLEKLIPTDKRIFNWLEAPDAQKMILANDMTQEELKAATYIRDWYASARDYLVTQGALKKYRSDYITHVRRGFLETWLESTRSFAPDVSGAKRPGVTTKAWGGLRAAIKEMFQQYKQDEAFFNIMNEKTGDVLPLEKFFQFSMKRTDELVPTKNVAKAFLKYAATFEKKRALDELIPKMDIYISSIAPKKLTPRGLEFDDSLKRFWKEWMNTKKGRVTDVKFVTPGGRIDWSLRTGVALTRIIDLGLNIPTGIASNFGAQISAYRGLGEKAFVIGHRRAFTKQGREIIKKYKALVGESVLDKVRAAEGDLGNTIQSGLFGLFSFADRKARQTFLLGAMTSEEFKTGYLSADRLTDIKLAMGRHMALENMSSVLGKTAPGKIFGQYRSWAVPLLYSTLDDINKLQKAVRAGDSSYLKSPEFMELMRTVLISSVAALGVHEIVSDKTPMKDRNFLYKLSSKAAQDSLSLVAAIDPDQWTGSPRLLDFLHQLGSGIKQTLLFKENAKGEFSGPRKVLTTLTPGLIKQVLPGKGVGAKKKKSSMGIPKAPDLPPVPKLPKTPKLPKLPELN